MAPRDAAGRRLRAARERAPDPESLARVGLGATILLAGGHKLLAPAAWTVYVADWLVPWLVVSPTAFVLINGWLEVAFGLAILLDRHTAVAAGVVAVSLTATVAYLGLVWALSGRFGDVLVRDVGLAALAWVVVIEATRPRSGGP